MAKNDVVTVGFEEFIADNVTTLVKTMEWMKNRQFKLIASVEELAAFVDEAIKVGRCAVDTETTGLNTRKESDTRIVGFSLCYDTKFSVYVPLNHIEEPQHNLPEKEAMAELKRLCSFCIVIFHNAKYDCAILERSGIFVNQYEKFEDTMLMAHLYDAGRKGISLKELSKDILKQPMLELTDICGKGNHRYDMVSPRIGYIYAASDAMCTFDLYNFFKETPTFKNQKGLYDIEKRVNMVVRKMEEAYVKIDKPYLTETKAKVAQVIERLKKNVCVAAGKEFNVSSTQQLGKVLFDELGYEYPLKTKTASGQYSTDTGTLEKIQDRYPLVKNIIILRGLEKTLGTYIENLLANADENDCIKLSFSQTGTDTGRFSSPGGKGLLIDGYSSCNIQSIPAAYEKGTIEEGVVDIRRAFIARPGFKIVAIDYSAEELRVAANLSREPKWVDEFINGSGDLHTKTAQVIFGKLDVTKAERQIGKCVAKGTLIASERGWVPIENLNEGDRVITRNGKLGKITKIHDMGIKPGIILTTTNGHKTTVGENHRFLSPDATGGVWVKAKNLKEGQIIKTVSCKKINPEGIKRVHFNIWDKGNNNFKSEHLPYIEISPLWARLIGYVLGDGNVCVNWTSVWCSEEYSDVKEDIMNTATKLGLTPRTHTHIYKEKRKDGTPRQPLHQIRIGSRTLVRFFREIGFTGRWEWKDIKNSPEKHHSVKIFRVPRVIFESPKEVSKEFISGLFETDGTVSHSEVSITTKDRELAEDLILLLASFGIKGKIRIKRSKWFNRDYYTVAFGRDGAEIFQSEIGFISSKKQKKLLDLIAKKKLITSTVIWETEVASVQPVEKVDLMDLTVEDDEGTHTYVAQGLVTHNTFNFQIAYGAGAMGLAEQAKISVREAKRHLTAFFEGLPRFKRWLDVEKVKARKQKFAITSFGRLRPLHMFYDSGDDGQMAHADRCACNFCIQGACADIMKIIMVRVYKYIVDNNLQNEIRILITMHDELVFEMKEDKLDIFIPKISEMMGMKDLLQDKLNWPVPLVVDAEYGDSWHVDHDYFKEKKAAGGSPKANTPPPPSEGKIVTPLRVVGDPETPRGPDLSPIQDKDGAWVCMECAIVRNEAEEKIPYTGKHCADCNEPQYTTPSGVTCKNGHGGAPSKEELSEEQPKEPSKQPMFTLAEEPQAVNISTDPAWNPPSLGGSLQEPLSVVEASAKEKAESPIQGEDDDLIYEVTETSDRMARLLNVILDFSISETRKNRGYREKRVKLNLKDKENNTLLAQDVYVYPDAFLHLARFFNI